MRVYVLVSMHTFQQLPLWWQAFKGFGARLKFFWSVHRGDTEHKMQFAASKGYISVRTWNLSLQTLSVQVLPRAGISSYPRQFIGATPKVIFTVMYD